MSVAGDTKGGVYTFIYTQAYTRLAKRKEKEERRERRKGVEKTCVWKNATVPSVLLVE